MSRITIVMNDNTVKKIRKIQAKKMIDENKTVSFSEVVNQLCEVGLKSD